MSSFKLDIKCWTKYVHVVFGQVHPGMATIHNEALGVAIGSISIRFLQVLSEYMASNTDTIDEDEKEGTQPSIALPVGLKAALINVMGTELGMHAFSECKKVLTKDKLNDYCEGILEEVNRYFPGIAEKDR